MDIGKEYQEKLIQYPIRIPCMNKDETEFYIMCLLSENELSETEFDGLLKFLQAKRKQNVLLEEPPFKRGDYTIQAHTLIVDIRSFLSQDKHIEHINVHLIILMRIMHF